MSLICVLRVQILCCFACLFLVSAGICLDLFVSCSDCVLFCLLVFLIDAGICLICSFRVLILLAAPY